MLSFDQGNPTLKSDDPGQTWQITTWFINCYKGGMSPVSFHSHMINLCKNYNSDAADAMYGSYKKGEDVEVTRASQLFALSTLAKTSFNNIKSKESPVAANKAVVSDGNALCSPTFGWVRQCGGLQTESKS